MSAELEQEGDLEQEKKGKRKTHKEFGGGFLRDATHHQSAYMLGSSLELLVSSSYLQLLDLRIRETL